MEDEWKLAGHIDVDAGCCWIGDPCYILPGEGDEPPFKYEELSAALFDNSPRKEVFSEEEYDALVKEGGLTEKQARRYATHSYLDHPQHVSIPHKMGHDGMGVVVHTGYGDGSYPVYVKYGDEGRVAEVRIVFMGENE